MFLGGVVKSIPPIFCLGFEPAGARVSPFVRITTGGRDSACFQLNGVKLRRI